MIQTAIVIMLVVCSVVHAGWTLMPRAVRQVLARKLMTLSLPLPGLLADKLQSATVAASGCGCHGCEHSSSGRMSSADKAPLAKAQPVVFHRKGVKA